jgi:hypothetical protein
MKNHYAIYSTILGILVSTPTTAQTSELNSICAAIENPAAYIGKTATFYAEIMHDGIHGGAVVDASCSHRGMRFDGPSNWPNHLATKDLWVALFRTGTMGTAHKKINATVTGIIEAGRQGPILRLTSIADLKVVPLQQ